jgi:Zn-finger nucleic acid-binding protein
MDCPNCKEGMIVLELNEVEIDYCISCKGIWLDSGELELLLENNSNLEKSYLLTPAKKFTEKKKKCPICYKKMDKIEVERSKKILIDKCKKGHGLWFDENELHDVILEASSKENKILVLLNEIFKHDINQSNTEEE